MVATPARLRAISEATYVPFPAVRGDGPNRELNMDDAKKTYREGEETAKEAWRKHDGEDMADKVGNAGDDLRKDLGNAGDEIRRPDMDESGTGTRPMGTPADDDLTDADAERPL